MDNITVHDRQFRIPFAHKEVIYDYVEELLIKGVIEYSRSPYNLPVFFVAALCSVHAGRKASARVRMIRFMFAPRGFPRCPRCR